MSQFDIKMTALADAIKAKNNNITGKLSIDGMTSAVKGITVNTGDSTVKFGYWTADGKFQQVDLSRDTPVDSGEPIAVDAVMFKTGQPEPEYPGSGSGSCESSIEFYECASYTPDADAYTKYSFTLSGAPDELANGNYVRTKYIESIGDDVENITASIWKNDKGYSFVEEYEAGEWRYYIKNSTGDYIYGIDSPMSRVTDFNSEYWVDWNSWEPVTLNFSAWQTEEVPATTEGWAGYKMNWVAASLPAPSNDIKAEFTFGGYVDYSGVFTLQDGNAVGGDRVWINTNPMGGEIKLNTTDSNVWEIILGGSVYGRFASGNPDITVEDMCATPPDATILTQVVTPALPARWEKSDTLTTGLTVTHLKPKVGEIFSADTSIRVRKMYDGAVYPIPSDGLVFYAPLQYDYMDAISKQTAVDTNGDFTTHNGLQCLQLDGSGGVKFPANSDVALGTSPLSMVIFIAPTNHYDWRTYLRINGGNDDETVVIHAKNGDTMEWAGSTYITANGMWQSIVITRDGNGDGKSYINGKFNATNATWHGSGENNGVNKPLSPPAQVYVGENIIGYIAFAAVYNRELTAEEIAEIHNTLMEDVEQ